MKKYIFGFVFIGFFGFSLLAQNGVRHERMEMFKRKFFNEHLALTESEQKDFWPIYNQYDKAKHALKKELRPDKKVALIPDDELEDFLNRHLEFEQRQLDLKKDFYRNVKAVLPIRKVAAIPKTEQQFKKKILEEMQRRRQERRGRLGG